MRFEPLGPLRGELTFPGDKSVCHRALILGALARGQSRVENFSGGEDNRSTLACLARLGVEIMQPNETTVVIEGVGLRGLREPDDVLDAGNSGTTMRIMCGLLAAQPFFSVLSGDRFLRNRPMKRVVEPLREMGAEIYGRQAGTLAPLAIVGRKLEGGRFKLSVASAQVKSALLLAGLDAGAETLVREPGPSRDHTERMLQYMGAELRVNGREVRLAPGNELRGVTLRVPGDISSAAFFMAAALIVPGSHLLLRGIGVNPTRTGIVEILRAMGGDIRLLDERLEGGEPVADLEVFASRLKGIDIEGDWVVRAIDEFPVLAVAATQAEGVTRIRGAEELRVKETDRLRAMTLELRKLGAQIEEFPDGMRIEGRAPLHGAAVESYHDHRVAMSLAVAAQVTEGAVEIADYGAVAVSYPRFDADLRSLADASPENG